MSEDSTSSSKQYPQYDPIFLIAVVVISVAIGAVAGVAIVSPTEDTTTTETPSVSCITFQTESGEASGMCFTSGDVEFRWLDQDNVQNWTANGSVDLGGLPENNSTVRRQE